jgi:large subunit ribosomal protein L9
MQVVLLRHVRNLGKAGDIKEVRGGYGKYLLREKTALRATPTNLDYFEKEKKNIEAANRKLYTDAEQLYQALTNYILPLARQASEMGQLFGSVTARDIADGMKEAGFQIHLNLIALPRPIKAVGVHRIELHLHPELTQHIQLVVAKTQEEAELHKQALERGETAEYVEATLLGKTLEDRSVPSSLSKRAYEEVAPADTVPEEDSVDRVEPTTDSQALVEDLDTDKDFTATS